MISSNHFTLCHPFLLLPSIFPSIRVFSKELAVRIRLPNYWSSSFSISLSNEYSGLISFRIAWLNVLTVQGAPKSSPTPQFKSISSSVLSLLYGQLSHLYTTPGKMVALTIGTFIGKVMSLLFNILSRFVIAFLPRSNHLLMSWLQSLSLVILQPKKRKSVTVSTFSASRPSVRDQQLIKGNQ